MKKELLKTLSENLSKFRPDLTNHFMCPVCWAEIPLENLSEISKAHIFPKFAKGELLTFLCSKCNSYFGSKQDKWFGEFLDLYENKKHPLQSKKKAGHFEIEGVKVNGRYNFPKEGPIEFVIDHGRNSQDTIEKVNRKLAENPHSLEFTVKSPIQENSNLVSVGFLTAAYLFWFRELGYSWVFQSHLDIVREQILHPEVDIIPNGYLLSTSKVAFDTPWIGVVDILNGSAAVMGVNDYLVIFPPASNRMLYEELLNTANEDNAVISYEKFVTDDSKQILQPIGIAYRNSAIVFPDHFKDSRIEPLILYYPGNGLPPQFLCKITADRRNELLKQENAKRVQLLFK